MQLIKTAKESDADRFPGLADILALKLTTEEFEAGTEKALRAAAFGEGGDVGGGGGVDSADNSDNEAEILPPPADLVGPSNKRKKTKK